MVEEPLLFNNLAWLNRIVEQKTSNFVIGCSIGMNKIVIFWRNRTIEIFGDIAVHLFDEQITALGHLLIGKWITGLCDITACLPKLTYKVWVALG